MNNTALSAAAHQTCMLEYASSAEHSADYSAAAVNATVLQQCILQCRLQYCSSEGYSADYSAAAV